MKKTNLLVTTLLVLMLASTMMSLNVQPAKATAYVFGSNTYSATAITLNNPDTAFATVIYAMSATDATMDLEGFTIRVKTTNGGLIEGIIWNYSSPYSVLAVSTNTFNSTTEAWDTFTFTDFTLYNNTNYYFGIIPSGAGAQICYDGSSAQTGHIDAANSYESPVALTPSHSGFCSGYVTASSSPAATPTPDPLPTGGLNVDTTDADAVTEALIGYGVPVVVMLLPVLFLWLIGGRGKWPFLMGIAIGTGMGYLFGLVPVWLVFIVSIVEIGMAYQSVRSGA